MDLGLAGRRALLVGAGRGIGAATAEALAREGCAVALVARTRAAVEERAAHCLRLGAPAALALAADATRADELEAAVAKAVDELGGLDLAFALVGGSAPGSTTGLDDAAWATAFERNLWAPVRIARLCAPHLEASARARGFHAPAPPSAGGAPFRDFSSLLHVASIWGREGGGPASYNAAKAALIAVAHAQARELAPRGIRVLSVSPGSVLHPGGSWEKRLQADPASIDAFVARELPFGRFGSAPELGEALAFLASPRASWIAGTSIVVDGGQSRSF